MIESLLTRVLGVEEINGAERCPTYLYRWTIWQPRWPRSLWRGFGIYLHKFVGDDWSRDLHDHPKRFISIGLRGSYVEQSMATVVVEDSYHGGPISVRREVERIYRAPWVRTFPAEHVHRLRLRENRRPCWTLVIVLRSVREWGFWHEGQWIHWKDYVKGSMSAPRQDESVPMTDEKEEAFTRGRTQACSRSRDLARHIES